MRVTIEGALTGTEIVELIEAVQAINDHDPRRVITLLFDDIPSAGVEEWAETLRKLGLIHTTIVPAGEERELGFETGGSVRLVPKDPKH